jgi:hypothetical protein
MLGTDTASGRNADLASGNAVRVDIFLWVAALCADRSCDPSPALLHDKYAEKVRFCDGFGHLETAQAEDPDESSVYLPWYQQVSEGCTLDALATGYRTELERAHGECGSESRLLALTVVLRDRVAADLRTAQRNYCSNLAEALNWWLGKLDGLVSHFSEERLAPAPEISR